MIEINKLPERIQAQVSEDIKKYGEDHVFYTLQCIPLVKKLTDLDISHSDYIWCRTAQSLVEHFATEDPTPMHFIIARDTIKNDVTEEINTRMVDILSRELVNHCAKINIKLTTIFDSEIKRKTDLESLITHIINQDQLRYEDGGLNSLDRVFINHLKSIGKEGESVAKELQKNSEERYEPYRSSGYDEKKRPTAWSLWINSDRSNNSLYVSILSMVLWNDVCKKIWEKELKQVPALTTSVNEPIRQILSPKNEIFDQGEETKIYHHGELVGRVKIPTLHPNLIPVVSSGVYKLNSVTGHRLIRHLVGGAFERGMRGDDDPRVLKLDRGATDMAEQLGLNGNQHVTNIKEILNAMAHFNFEDRAMSGNLIQLSRYKSPITGREEEGYLITIGTPLLPYRTFEAHKKGECGLLIPLLKDPPLIGSYRSHAGQYLLQMTIMAFFSKMSINLFTDGAIEITKRELHEFMISCGLSAELMLKVMDRWTRDGDDGAMFLERIDRNFYTLGEAYTKERDFLIRQGELRVSQANRGKASAIQQKIAKGKKSKKLP